MWDQKNQGYVVFAVQEFMSGGSLNTRLWGKPFQSVAWSERVQWALDTAEGVCFIHSKGFIHRDLKSQNILYQRESGRAKVADFGTVSAPSCHSGVAPGASKMHDCNSNSSQS